MLCEVKVHISDSFLGFDDRVSLGVLLGEIFFEEVGEGMFDMVIEFVDVGSSLLGLFDYAVNSASHLEQK